MSEVENRNFMKTGRSVVWILIALGIFFRFYNLDHRVYWHDEVFTSHHVSGYTYLEMILQLTGRLVEFKEFEPFQHPNPGRGPEYVLASLCYSQPEHAPLFYLAAYYWAKAFGSAIVTMRCLPALFSLLQLPAAYWFAMELFAQPLAAELAVAFLALSPVQVLYAQEVREYSLITAVICLISAAFLRAIRKSSWRDWLLYLFTLIVGFYSSVLTGLVIVAHCLYIVSLYGLRLSKKLTGFLLAVSVALLAYVPWLTQLVQGRQSEIVHSAIVWLSRPVPGSQLVSSWLNNFPKILVDFGGNYPAATNCLNAFILLLELYALYFILRQGRHKPTFLLITLFLVPAIGLPLCDIIFGGQRSIFMKYMMPVPVAVVLSLAYLLFVRQNTGPSNLRKLWYAIAYFIFACEIASCAILSQATNWPELMIWHQDVAAVAHIVNADPQALVVTERGVDGTNFLQMVALSHRVKPNTYLEFFEKPAIPQLPTNFDHFYLFNPDHDYLDLLTSKGYVIAPANRLDYLWIVKKSLNP